jgi:2'-5' RNA ligase
VPPALVDLQSQLEAGLRAAGFILEERPYRPHVTLARKIARPVPTAAIEPIGFACEALALVVSEAGRYTSLESWPLAQGPRGSRRG